MPESRVIELEQQLAALTSSFTSAETSTSEIQSSAVAMLDFTEKVLSSADLESMRPELWHDYLDISGQSRFLTSLGSEKARTRWAAQVFEIVDRTGYSLRKMLEQRIAEHPQHLLFKQAGINSSPWSYAHVFDHLKKVAAAFYNASKEPRVLIYLDNCPEGACADLACLTFGILNSPIDRHFDASTIAFIVRKLGINIVVTDTEARLHRLIEVQKQSGIELTVFVTDPHNRELRKSDLYLGEASSHFSTEEAEAILKRQPPPDLHRVSTVMFTSGSTGEPKGVAFTNYNLIVKRFARAAALPDVGKDEVLFCYLPLFHTFGRFLEMMGMLYWRGTYVFAGNTSRETFLKRLNEVQPTGLIGIPLRWRQIEQQCLEQLESAATALHEKAVFRSVVGTKLRWGLSAAGYLPPRTFKFFNRNGVALCCGFGMTEATGGITMTPPNNYQDNSVGIPLPGMLMRLTEETELEIAGPYMARYLHELEGKDPAAKCFNARTETSWMKTGDLFRIDKDGHYYIVDRLKDIYKNNRGQTIAPRRVEQKFNDVPGIKNVFLVGDARDYNVLLIAPDLNEPLLTATSDMQEIERYFKNIVTAANQELMPYERVINIALLERDFDIEKGELTPKNSFRRKQVEENFSTVIEGLYVRDFVEFECTGLTVRVPRWFFRDLGVLEEDDIECSIDGLYDKSRDCYLPIRLVGDNVLIGDLEYSLDSNLVDLGLFARQPLLWAGNPALLAFCPCKEGWDAHLGGIATHVFLPYRDESQIPTSETISTAFSDQRLKDAHDLFRQALFGPEDIASHAIDQLEEMLADSDSHMASLLISRLEALARHPVENIRCQAYAVHLLNRPMPDFHNVFPAFLNSGLSFINDSLIHRIRSTNIERRRLEALRLRMLNYRTRLPWPATPVIVDQIGKILQLMADFVRNNPEFYYAIRGELASWVVSKTDTGLMQTAEQLLIALSEWYETYLFGKINLYEAGDWVERMVFEEGISKYEIKRLSEAFAKTTFLHKSIAMAFDVHNFDLKEVPRGGIWFSRLLSQRGQHVYRVSINTAEGGHYELMVTLREDYAAKGVRRVLCWLMAISDHPFGPGTLPRLGCSRPDLGVLSVAFVNNLTLWERIREYSSARTNIFVKQKPDFLRKLFTRGMAAFFAACRNSGYQIVPGQMSPVNVVVPEPDYRAGATILSLGGWRKYEEPMDLVRPLIKNFYEQTAMHYPFSKEILDKTWIFDACIEALGREDGVGLLNQMLENPASFETRDDHNLLELLKAYLEKLEKRYYVPISLISAVQRYAQWNADNPESTPEAKENLLDTLFQLYGIDRFGEIARYYLYRHTYFEDCSAEVGKAYDYLLGVMNENPAVPAISLPALSDLQATLDSSNDRHVFGHLVFPRARKVPDLEVLSIGDKSTKHVVVKSHITAHDGTHYFVREATEPTEIGQLYRMFLQQRYTKRVSEHDQFLVLVDSLDRLVGGVCYVLETHKVVQLDGIVIARQLQSRGLGSALLEDFCMRMSNRGFEVIRTHYYRRNFYLQRSFQTDKRWGGLVRFLESQVDENNTSSS